MTTTSLVPYQLQDHSRLTTDNGEYVLRVRDMDEADRPRERMMELGPGSLSVAELLAVVWGVGSRSEDVLVMARRTLKEYGERAISSELNPRRLSDAAGIPLTKACQIVASLELGRRYANPVGRPVYIRNAKQAFSYFRSMAHSQKEQLRGLYLNSRYQVIHDEVISVGSLTASIIHPREVFRPAIERGAVALILAHNHPSAQLQPTMADIQITEQLMAAGELLGIEVLDHLVIVLNRFVSIKEEFIGHE